MKAYLRSIAILLALQAGATALGALPWLAVAYLGAEAPTAFLGQGKGK